MNSASQGVVHAGDLRIDRGRFNVSRDGREIPLPRLSFDLLLALVEAAPNVASIDDLMQRVWPGLVVAPETVSQRVKLLRYALGDSAELPRYIEAVRGRGYRLAVSVEAEPITRGGPEARQDAPAEATHQNRPVSQAVVVLLLVAVLSGMAAWLLPWGDPHPDSGHGIVSTARVGSPTFDAQPEVARTSIAVLPLASFSSRAEDRLFADGLHDDLLTRLAQVPSLRVIARTSVEQFRDSRRDSREIGRLLGAGSLLEGSVQREAQRLRVNLQLIDTRTQEHLWAQRIDRELTAEGLFDIQDEIVAAVVNALPVRLAGDPGSSESRRPTGNLAAWEAYQRGKTQMASRNTAGVEAAGVAFERAIALDPQFAEAHAALAHVHILRVEYSNAERHSALALADASARRALKLQPDLADAHVAIAGVAELLNEFEAADRAYRRAIEVNPNHVLAHHWYSGLLAMLARPGEAMHHAKQAARLDPLGIAVNVNLGFAYARLGRFADAHAQFRKVLEIDPLNANAHGLIGELYSRAYGRLDLGVPWERRSLKLDPGFAVPVRRLAIAQIDLGDDEEARRLLDAARAANAPWIDTVTAMYHETRGELSEAVASAERALARSDAELWRNSMSLVVLRNADLEAGRPEVALARFNRERPELFGSTPPVIDARNADTAISVAQLLLTTGKTDQANELLVAVGAFLAPFSPLGAEGFGLARVRVLALEGRRAEALRELEEAVAIGWRGPYWRYARDRDPELAPIRDDPRFRAAFGRVERDIQAQRTRLAARPADAPLPLLATADLQLVRTAGT